MKQLTIERIRAWNPCYDPTKYLPEGWSGTPLDILNDKRIPVNDRFWVILRPEILSDRTLRLFAVWCARQVQHLMGDPRSVAAIDVAERYANGDATDEELLAAWAAARTVAWAAARAAAESATRDIARDSAWGAVSDAVRAAARGAAMDAQVNKLREMLLAELKTK